MHNEGAPRHHAGAPGPLLYLKPRSLRNPQLGSADPLRRRRRRRQPGSRALRPRRASFSVRPAPLRELGLPPPARGSSLRAEEGEGTRGGPGRGKAGSARTPNPGEPARDARPRRAGSGGGEAVLSRAGGSSRARAPPAARRTDLQAGAEQNAPAAPRGPAAPPRPRGLQPPGAALSAARQRRGSPPSCRKALGSGSRTPDLSDSAAPGSPLRSPGAPAALVRRRRGSGQRRGAHGFMRTPMPGVRRTRANFPSGSANAAPRASSPFRCFSPGGGGRRCPRWWPRCWAAAR